MQDWYHEMKASCAPNATVLKLVKPTCSRFHDGYVCSFSFCKFIISLVVSLSCEHFVDQNGTMARKAISRTSKTQLSAISRMVMRQTVAVDATSSIITTNAAAVCLFSPINFFATVHHIFVLGLSFIAHSPKSKILYKCFSFMHPFGVSWYHPCAKFISSRV